MEKKWKLFMLVLLVTLLIAAGCSKVTKENYDKLKMGMEYDEVTALLGNPDTCTEVMSTKNCIWGTESKNIAVSFLADTVVVFSCTGVK